MRLGTAILLPHLAAGWNFNFGSFGRDEKILLYGDGFDRDSVVHVGLWDLNLEADVQNYIPLENCEVLHQDTFENSNEFLPLTQSGYYFLACDSDQFRYFLLHKVHGQFSWRTLYSTKEFQKFQFLPRPVNTKYIAVMRNCNFIKFGLSCFIITLT